MQLPDPANMYLLLVRTDYADDDAWRAVVNALTSGDDGAVDGATAPLLPVEAPELNGLEPADLVLLPRAGHHTALAVADTRTMQDGTILFVDLNEFNEQVGRTFRATPHEVESITANLGLANMDFFEFADAAGGDGVFRGFGS